MSVDIKAHRQKLIDEGAVDMFHKKSQLDEAAIRATDGLPPGMPGLGLYRVQEGIYEARVENKYQFEGCPDYNTLTADDWRDYLRNREPKAEYIHHWKENGHNPINWSHVIVKFHIQVIE